jgi:hypothetical protein
MCGAENAWCGQVQRAEEAHRKDSEQMASMKLEIAQLTDGLEGVTKEDRVILT